MIILRGRRSRELALYKVLRQTLQVSYRSRPNTDSLLKLKGWTFQDLIQELYLFILSSPNKSPSKLRELWLDRNWSWQNSDSQKQFRGWVNAEIDGYIKDNLKSVRRERAQYWIFNGKTRAVELIERKKLEDDVKNRLLIDTIGKWVETECSLQEQFIFLHHLGLVNLEWSEGQKSLMNFPGKPVSRRTFFNRKKDFNEKMKDYLEKRRNNDGV